MTVTELVVVTLPDRADMRRRLASLPHAQYQEVQKIIFDKILGHAGEQLNGCQIADIIAAAFSAYVRTHPTGKIPSELTNGRRLWIDGSAVLPYLAVLVDDEQAKLEAAERTDKGWVIKK